MSVRGLGVLGWDHEGDGPLVYAVLRDDQPVDMEASVQAAVNIRKRPEGIFSDLEMKIRVLCDLPDEATLETFGYGPGADEAFKIGIVEERPDSEEELVMPEQFIAAIKRLQDELNAGSVSYAVSRDLRFIEVAVYGYPRAVLKPRRFLQAIVRRLNRWIPETVWHPESATKGD
jgi:hypothetical protein